MQLAEKCEAPYRLYARKRVFVVSHSFLSFAKAHGILIDTLPPLGVWRRYPTDDHPGKRNGAVKWMGDAGFIQNWATDQEVVVWKADENTQIDMSRLRREAAAAEQKRRMQQDAASKKAGWIMHQCQQARHEYLKRKGFAEDLGNVWVHEGKQILVVPMRVAGRIVGCQLIQEDGEKKFLFGQRTSDAEYIIDNKGPNILVEGYATALSVQLALKSLKRRYTLHVCFSAGNLVKVSKHVPKGFVIADNDASGTGEKAAKDTGWPYFMPPTVGHDFNDMHQSMGLFKTSQALNKAMIAAGIPAR